MTILKSAQKNNLIKTKDYFECGTWTIELLHSYWSA